MSILSLENEPGNLQLGEAHHKVEAQVHVQKETQMKLPLVEAKEKIAQKSALTENDHIRCVNLHASTVNTFLPKSIKQLNQTDKVVKIKFVYDYMRPTLSSFALM